MDEIKLVGEIGINHNGDIKIAKRLIDMACIADFDFVKFQKRTLDLVYKEEELNALRESPWGRTVRAQKEALEFDEDEYEEIDEYCKKKGIQWFASAWDIESVNFLADLDVPYVKIPSPLVTKSELIEEIRETGIPVIMSTGMSLKRDIEGCVDTLDDQIEYILACTSTYPTPIAEMNMNFIRTLKEEYPDFRIGFSNHNPGLTFCIVAAALGAELIEVHITLDRAMYGSDQAASIEPEGMMRLRKYTRSITGGMGDGKWTVFPGEIPVMKKLRRS